MISLIFQIVLLLVLVPILLCMQCINLIITVIQYVFVHTEYKNIQELFFENSSYINAVLHQK